MLHAIWQARYEILASCCAEMQRAGILAPASPPPPPFAQLPSPVVPACTVAAALPACEPALTSLLCLSGQHPTAACHARCPVPGFEQPGMQGGCTTLTCSCAASAHRLCT